MARRALSTTPQAPLVLCVASGDGLRGAFAAIDGKQAQGRQLQVRRGVKADEFKACHILFVPEGEEPRRAGALAPGRDAAGIDGG